MVCHASKTKQSQQSVIDCCDCGYVIYTPHAWLDFFEKEALDYEIILRDQNVSLFFNQNNWQDLI